MWTSKVWIRPGLSLILIHSENFNMFLLSLCLEEVDGSAGGRSSWGWILGAGLGDERLQTKLIRPYKRSGSAHCPGGPPSSLTAVHHPAYCLDHTGNLMIVIISDQ